MDYSQTISFLFSKLPLFSRLGAAAYKKDLTHTSVLCEALGNPQQRFRTLHVAGTNGKGSVSHMLASILQTAGYKTGLYTSPHLYDFRERIRVNGEMISEASVVQSTASLYETINRLQPSFFEVTVAMAFDHFARQQVDIAIIETGLGGRLDSTNVITPILSVITNIGWDHQQLLGDSLEKIAGEKAGIIKPNVPVVLGEFDPVTFPVFEQKAAAENARLIKAEERLTLKSFEWKGKKLQISIEQKDQTVYNYELDLPGIYQTKNLLTVLEAIHQLQQLGWSIGEEAIVSGLATTRSRTGLAGRWQQIAEHPSIVIDVAHNESGIRQLLAQLARTRYNNLHIVIGFVKDKSIATMVALLPKEATYYFTKAQLPRALPENELQTQASTVGLKGRCFAEANQALDAARAAASPQDLILICGSIFLAGEINLREENDPSTE